MHPEDAPQVKPLCVEFHRWSNKEKTALFAQKAKIRGYGKEGRIKAYAGHPRHTPIHSDQQRRSHFLQGVTF